MAKIDTFFHYLIATKGSDLHLSEGQVPKIRVHGAVVNIPDQEVLQGSSFRELLAEICDANAFQSYLEEGDLDFAYEMDEDSRFRCNYLKQQNGLAAVFRLIPTEIASLESLGVPDVVKEFGHMRSGLVLVTGPTGSGKSTTLAALLDYININFNRHIITVEEPIEFVHRNKRSIITQREVPIQTPSFADGLRAALREDSDIVLVGEMRANGSRNRLTRLRHASHEQRPENCGPDHRRISCQPAIPSPHHARRIATRRSRPTPMQARGQTRSDCRA
jgi:twitching motility protein PilT